MVVSVSDDMSLTCIVSSEVAHSSERAVLFMSVTDCPSLVMLTCACADMWSELWDDSELDIVVTVWSVECGSDFMCPCCTSV